MQALNQQLLDKAIAMTNQATKELGLSLSPQIKADIFNTVLNHLIYAQPEGGTNAPLSEQTARDNRSAVSGG